MNLHSSCVSLRTLDVKSPPYVLAAWVAEEKLVLLKNGWLDWFWISNPIIVQLRSKIDPIQSSDSPTLIQNWSNPRIPTLRWDDNMQRTMDPNFVRCLQSSAKVLISGFVTFISALANHLCLNLDAAFTKPCTKTLAYLCSWYRAYAGWGKKE